MARKSDRSNFRGKARMSVLVSGSFVQMQKETATVMTQTEDSERLKQFSIVETQTDVKETAVAKCQTDRADAVNASSQTRIFACNEESVQTERNEHSRECQTILPVAEIECQTSLYSESETPSESVESERLHKSSSDINTIESIDGETGNKALKFKA